MHTQTKTDQDSSLSISWLHGEEDTTTSQAAYVPRTLYEPGLGKAQNNEKKLLQICKRNNIKQNTFLNARWNNYDFTWRTHPLQDNVLRPVSPQNCHCGNKMQLDFSKTQSDTGSMEMHVPHLDRVHPAPNKQTKQPTHPQLLQLVKWLKWKNTIQANSWKYLLTW